MRTQTLVKSAIFQVDATPFKQWYSQHYGVEIGRKKKPTTAAAKKEKEAHCCCCKEGSSCRGHAESLVFDISKNEWSVYLLSPSTTITTNKKLTSAIASTYYGDLGIEESDIFISDGAKCGISRLQWKMKVLRIREGSMCSDRVCYPYFGFTSLNISFGCLRCKKTTYFGLDMFVVGHVLGVCSWTYVNVLEVYMMYEHYSLLI
ncbi:40S ribosomal protein S8 [Iris pallida]|uniref:40S ribosomal protein S8 n=1 Tax=Iris pallida TaxID=29817 RepID=A0AAX6GLA5_IRIPA|nr:40S ribosomal protein S8 [Iris pallida]KAJ6829569.1 40S ribosomal protein S8 [Iris pallida]